MVRKYVRKTQRGTQPREAYAAAVHDHIAGDYVLNYWLYGKSKYFSGPVLSTDVISRTLLTTTLMLNHISIENVRLLLYM